MVNKFYTYSTFLNQILTLRSNTMPTTKWAQVEVNTKHKQVTEQASVTATLETCIPEVLGSNSTGSRTILTEVLRSFPQSIQANSGIVPPLGHNHFLPNFSAIILLSDAWDADKAAKGKSA
jgi:hypothetical protein